MARATGGCGSVKRARVFMRFKIHEASQVSWEGSASGFSTRNSLRQTHTVQPNN